jgi:hypothetical protein
MTDDKLYVGKTTDKRNVDGISNWILNVMCIFMLGKNLVNEKPEEREK